MAADKARRAGDENALFQKDDVPGEIERPLLRGYDLF
jgi:hypothetical protein